MPGFIGPYPGWEKDHPDVSNYWQVLQPAMKQALDKTGLEYEWMGSLGAANMFALKVAPATTHAQLYDALKNIPGFFCVEPNGIMRGWGEVATPFEPTDPTPADDGVVFSAQADDRIVGASAMDNAYMPASVADEMFESDDILEQPEPVLS
jgi:hypothetical protein